MFAKLREPSLLSDLRPLLPACESAKLTDEAVKAAFRRVFTRLIARLPGEPWSRTAEMVERFRIEAHFDS